jgi:hypothetical protein
MTNQGVSTDEYSLSPEDLRQLQEEKTKHSRCRLFTLPSIRLKRRTSYFVMSDELWAKKTRTAQKKRTKM